MERFEFQVGENFHRRRLDEFLFNEFTRYSKAYLRGAVKRELCQVNGYIANTGIELRSNDFIEIFVEPGQAKSMEPKKMPLDIVFEDEELIVVDKKPGILVHPTHFERDGTLLSGLTHYLNRGRDPNDPFVRPHLVHRLDRETSGLIVIAKTVRASSKLCRQIAKRKFKKRYLALVDGLLMKDEGEIKAPIGRDAELKKHMVLPEGKESLSRFRVVERYRDSTLIELEPVTGRTNQLRIHCAHIGHPILGDTMFAPEIHSRLFLHASKIVFRHPNNQENIQVESESGFREVAGALADLNKAGPAR